jgi:FkbM family methyltransferase
MLGIDMMKVHPELNCVDFRKGSRVILDVGANRGNFATNILLGAPLSEVHCFEPNPELFPELEAKCRSLGSEKGRPRAIANGIGVGTASGTLDLIVTNFAPASSMLPVSEASRSGWPKADLAVKRRNAVPVRTIREYAGAHNIKAVKILKMDVQGFEMEVLKGCGDFLGHIEYIYAEIQFRPLYEGAPLWTDMLKYLKERGFRPELMGGICLGPAGEPLQADLLWRNCRS